MKKICYVNPTVLLKRPIAEIIEMLGDKYELSLLIPRKKKVDCSLHYSNVRKARVISYPIMQSSGNSEWPIPKLGFFGKAWKILKNNDIIHIWVPFYLSSSILAVIKGMFFRNKKLILTMDTVPAYSFSMGKRIDLFFKIYYKTLGKIVFGCCDKITLYGESLVPYAKKAGVPMNKVKITPTGVNVLIKKSDKDIRKEFGIAKNENIALFVGLIVPRKGIGTVIRTANLMRNEKIKFILVGDGPNRKRYEQISRKIGLQDKVIFTGFRKDVHNFYNQSDVFFFPSKGEGLAGVIMEAMSYGLPVVSSRIPCTEDLIKHKENGFLSPIDSAECYTEFIREILADKRLRAKFIINSKQIIKKKYGWNGNIKGFEGMY